MQADAAFVLIVYMFGVCLFLTKSNTC